MNVTETTKSPALAPDDPRVVRTVEDYVSALEAGEHPDREAFLARHADIRATLAGCLDGLQFIRAARPQLDNGPTAEDAAAAAPLGDFRIISEIGRGGMGIVYEAVQISLGRTIALKVLPFASTLDPKQLQRFKNEAQAAAGLHHTNIVPVFATGCERGVHYYAMQFIEGQSLSEVIAAGRPHTPCAELGTRSVPATIETPPDARLSTLPSTHGRAFFHAIARLGIQAAEALDYSHELGIVHRDIKPANLLVDGRGKLWITDFGLAHCQSQAGLTMSGDLVGTLRYMSPEQAMAKRVLVDHRTDIYSLGATLYELLTSEPVFSGHDRQDLLRQIAFEEPKAPRKHNKAIPAELETVVLKALEKNPADRYGTAMEVAEDLERFVKDEPIRARRASLARRAKGWYRRRKPLVAALLTLLILAGAALLWRQVQRVATARAVDDDLREAVPSLRDGHWAKALPALERAQARVEESGGGSLGNRVSELRRELSLLSQLEAARKKTQDYTGESRDYAGADQAYRRAFTENGLDPAKHSAEEIARQIRTFTIGTHLVIALDHWAFVKDRLPKDDGEPLRAITRLADDDEWRQKLRAPGLRKSRELLERLADEQGTLAQQPATLLILCDLLSKANAPAAKLRLLRRAQERYPADFWINLQLAEALADEIKFPTSLTDAMGFYRAAIALDPQNAVPYHNLAGLLAEQKRLPEAEAAYRKAIELNPTGSNAYANLAGLLAKQKKLPEAEAVYRNVIEFDPTFAYNRLADLLRDQQRLPEAIDLYRKVKEIKPEGARGYFELGLALFHLDKFSQAEVAFRKTIELRLEFAPGDYHNLAVCLQLQDKFLDAAMVYRKVTEFQPDRAVAHWRTGNSLEYAGKFVDSLASFKRAHELYSLHPNSEMVGLEQQTARLRRLESWLALDAKLPQILSGEVRPADAFESYYLAGLCRHRSRQLYAASARFFGEAFAADAKLATPNDGDGDLYDAGCVAAMAGCGLGKDAANLPSSEYVRLRGQALAWLGSDLRERRREFEMGLEKEPEKARRTMLRYMQHWQADPNLRCVRGEAALAKLPEDERREWQKLWDEQAELERRASATK